MVLSWLEKSEGKANRRQHICQRSQPCTKVLLGWFLEGAGFIKEGSSATWV